MGAARKLSDIKGHVPALRLVPQLRELRSDGTKATMSPPRAPRVPGAGEVLIRPVRLAITSPDIAVYLGRAGFVGVLGHACVAIVEQVGAARDVSAGDKPRVRLDTARWAGKRVVLSSRVVCGACERCKSGLSQHCVQRRAIGMQGHDGVFADQALVPAANLSEVPEGMDDDTAVFASHAAGALHACSLVRVEHKLFVTVLGDGPIGLLAAQWLAKRNASVRLVGKHAGKSALCEKWGVRHRLLSEIGRHQDQDVVIDCTGSPLGTEIATHLVRPRGTVIVKGWPVPRHDAHAGAARVNLSHALAHELTLIGAGAGSITSGLEALRTRELDAASLLTTRFRFSAWEKAFAAAQEPESVCVVMDV